MESVARLRSVIVEALGSQGQQTIQQELFDELMIHRPRLLKVFDVGSRDAQQQREIESGKTIIDGKSIAVNAEFAKQAIFLSQQLETSERYVASVLHAVMSENPNIGAVSFMEKTVAEFHERRRHLADSLRLLLEAAQSAEDPDASVMYKRIHSFIQSELIPGSAASGSDSLASKILKEMENIGGLLTRADAARRNARSNTVAPSAQEAASLGLDILNARYESLKYERRALATSLYLIARLGYFSANEVKPIVDWLALNPSDSMTYYMLASVLAALDPVDPASAGGKSRSLLANDRNTVAFMTKKLAQTTTEWKDIGLKSIVLMKWTLFLTEVRHRNPELETREGFQTEELESQIRNAIVGDAFTYAVQAVLHLQRGQGGLAIPSLLLAFRLSSEQLEQREAPAPDFTSVVLAAFENLVRSLITHASSELRKIKQRQEDLVHASVRTDRARAPTRFASTAPVQDERPPRNDIGIFYSFVGLLYSSLPEESALQFWGSGPQIEASRSTYLEYLESTAGRLPAFLQWAVWSVQPQDLTMCTALYDMIAGLSKGQQCSELAYNFLARGGNEVIQGSTLPVSSASAVSWEAIFTRLDTWATTSANTRNPAPTQSFGFGGFGQQQQAPPPQKQVLGPEDVLYAQAFLRLLSNVVTFSFAVRVALYGNVQFRVIPTLLALIPLSVPLELKGALFDTLAAFSQPGGGAQGVEICRTVWTMMERLEIINVRGASSQSFGSQVKGVEIELEEIEATHGLYPTTIPFLRLLSALIHTPKRVQLRHRVMEATSLNTIPESLGQPYRLPGIGPFVTFVLDNVFSKIASRDYMQPSDRWQINDLCLTFIERCLASFDMESVLAAADGGKVSMEILTPLLIHPGYDILRRLLTSSTLQSAILSYIVEGVEGFERGFASSEPYFQSTIIRVLRIALRVLEIQDIFLDVFLPLLADIDSSPYAGLVPPRAHFVKFDKALSFNPQYVSAICTYVAYPGHSELVLLAIKITAALSSSSAINNLADIIQRSSESERILSGFIDALATESSENIALAEEVSEAVTGAGAPDPDSSSTQTQATRLAALDVLIQGTEQNRPYPSIAHFLLFGSAHGAETQIQDPHALGARQTCIHVLINLLNTGIPRVKGTGRERHVSARGLPLFVTLPALAERCYHVMYQLCVHPRTSDATMRYLRTREDFFIRHLAAIPTRAPETLEDGSIQIVYNDGARVISTVTALSAFLRLQSWVLDLVALDLHLLTNKAHHKAVVEVLDILYGNDPVFDEPLDWEDSMVFREFGQSHMRVIEIVQSLTFDWTDEMIVEPVDIQLLRQLDLQACVRKDAWGCDVIDRGALVTLLSTARRTIQTHNTAMAPAHIEQLNVETQYILESSVVENSRREIINATGAVYESWRRLLDTTLIRCFQRLPHDKRESMLFDLLHVLPSIIRNPDVLDSTAILISEVILSTVAKLREDRRYQIVVQSADGDLEACALPAERLYSIFRSILECILVNNRHELVRGNLYASLINYIRLISEGDGGNDTAAIVPDSVSLSVSASNLSLSLISPKQLSSTSSNATIQLNNLSLLKTVAERLVTTVSRDAIDGTEIWRTVAFMLLDAFIQLSALEKQHIMLNLLTRHGVLVNFVKGVQESDLLLQSVLKPDPDDLNPLYVYEAKMSLFIRMAQSRAGSEKLLDAQILPILGQCDYLDARPEADQSFIDDTFLPSAIQRYHQLLMPSLQLINTLLATLGSKHVSAAKQALEFISKHSSTLVILLKTDLDDAPLSLIDEMHLIVSICNIVLPYVPKSEVASTNSGFGAIHSAVISLSGRSLANEQWLEHIRPQTDAEIAASSTRASAFGSESVYEASLRRKEQLLRQAFVAYIGSASEFTEPEITLLLSPLTSTPRQETLERGSTFIATIPSIGDALKALDALCITFSHALQQISDISSELAAKNQLRTDNIQEMLGHSTDPEFIGSLDATQKRSLLSRELIQLRNDVGRNAGTLLTTLEMVLLLLWRHLQHYYEGNFGQPLDSSLTSLGSSSHALRMRFLSAPDPDAFRLDVGNRLVPILGRLQSVLSALVSYPKWKHNQLYLEIMLRRLRQSIGLGDDGNMYGD